MDLIYCLLQDFPWIILDQQENSFSNPATVIPLKSVSTGIIQVSIHLVVYLLTIQCIIMQMQLYVEGT